MPTRKIGKGGHVVVLGKTLHVIKHDYDGNNDCKDVTTTGSAEDGSGASTEYIPGYSDRTFSADFFMDFQDPEHLYMLEGATGTCRLKLANTANYVEGSIIVKTVKITNAAKEVVSGTITLQVTGGLTRA